MHALTRRAVDGAAMSTGLDRIEPGSYARIGHRLSDWSEKTRARYLKPGHVLLLALLLTGLIAGTGVWLFVLHKGAGAPAQLVAAAPHAVPSPATATADAANKDVPFDPATAEAIVPEPPAPLDKVMISSQSWRRGGLGSNALVTFTLRNNNSYAVKDIEITCAFVRRDGSHLTDRSRLIPDTVNTRSRKTFVRMHVGFVNINASRAKCSPIAANRA